MFVRCSISSHSLIVKFHIHKNVITKLILLLWRTDMKFLKKLKIELPYDPTISFLDIPPEKNMV